MAQPCSPTAHVASETRAQALTRSGDQSLVVQRQGQADAPTAGDDPGETEGCHAAAPNRRVTRWPASSVATAPTGTRNDCTAYPTAARSAAFGTRWRLRASTGTGVALPGHPVARMSSICAAASASAPPADARASFVSDHVLVQTAACELVSARRPTRRRRVRRVAGTVWTSFGIQARTLSRRSRGCFDPRKHNRALARTTPPRSARSLARRFAWRPRDWSWMCRVRGCGPSERNSGTQAPRGVDSGPASRGVGRPGAGLQIMAELDRELPPEEPLLPLFPLDVIDQPQLVRIALAAGDRALAQHTSALEKDRAEQNPSLDTGGEQRCTPSAC